VILTNVSFSYWEYNGRGVLSITSQDKNELKLHY